MRNLILGMLCGVAVGCNESSRPASSTVSTKESVTTVTANRPTITPDHSSTTTEPVGSTNTAVNVRDRDNTAKTPFAQNENKADIQITADIRKRVVAAKMSSDAHNVKIITQDGKVTLRGPVKTEDEKQRIDDIAVDVAGAKNVDSQLDVEKK